MQVNGRESEFIFGVYVGLMVPFADARNQHSSASGFVANASSGAREGEKFYSLRGVELTC